MRLLHFILCFACFITGSFLHAQQNYSDKSYTISGKVTNKADNSPLEYATIILKDKFTKKVTGGITNQNGEFAIKATKSTYHITIEFLGFKPTVLKDQLLASNLNLGTIALVEDANSLDEVEIVAEKSTVEIKLDKRIYNVGKDMTVRGGTAADVLDNIPSVAVDVEGNVSLRGNDNVRILINGKPSGLIGLSATEALRQFPADAILKVEVITNPSARYDAEGTAGILNIVLRKGKGNGFNGSLTATAGHPELYGLSGNANYRKNKINMFSNAGYRYRTGPGNSSINATYLDNNGNISSFREERLIYDRQSSSFNINLGTEYSINKKHSITATLLARNSGGEDVSTNNAKAFDVNRIFTGSQKIVEIEKEEDKTFEYSFNYTGNFDDDGHKLTFDFQRSSGNEIEDSNINDSDLLFDLLTRKDESNVGYLIQSDYVKPITQNSQFEIGFRFNLDELNTPFTVDTLTTSNQVLRNDSLSNDLKFIQNVYAAYAQYGGKVKEKFSYLFGLRMETTDIKIDLRSRFQNDKNYKKYTQLFPTINFGYEINDNNSMTLGFSRRLRRPRSWFLSPFRSFTSRTSYFQGNIDLDPTFTSSFDLGYLKKWDKLTLNSSIYYQHTTNNFQFINEEVGTIIINGETVPEIRRTPINLSSEDRYGFELTTNYNPSRKVRFTGSFNFFRFIVDGNNYSLTDSNGNVTFPFDADNTSWTARFNTRITLPGSIDWQTRLFYRGPQKAAQVERKGIFSTNLAFSKDLFKEKATISLNVSDLFNSRKRRSKNTTPRAITENEFQWRERQITLNFIYRFNQQKKQQRSRGDYNGGDEGGF